MSIHWGVVTADVVAGLAFATAVPSDVYARKADRRAERAERRIDIEEARNAVRWQLELSREPNQLWLRNVGTQDAGAVTVLFPDKPMLVAQGSRMAILHGDAVWVRLTDPGRTVTSILVQWLTPYGGNTVNVPLPNEWMLVPTPQPRFVVEQVDAGQYRLRNVGDATARRVIVRDDSGLVRNLPDGVDLSQGEAHRFVIVYAEEAPALDGFRVTWDGLDEPVYVAIP